MAKAGVIHGAMMMIIGLVGIADSAIIMGITTTALAIPSSLITARGGRASTAKYAGRSELAPPPEVSDGHTANPQFGNGYSLDLRSEPLCDYRHLGFGWQCWNDSTAT